MNEAIKPAQANLCTKCHVRPLLYGNAQEGYCEPCMRPKMASLPLSSANGEYRVEDQIVANQKAHLNAKQKQIMERQRRKNKPLVDPEENWGGYCKGGCGKFITGSYYCPDCKKKEADKNFAVQPGEVELFRGNVGKPEDKIVKQVVAIEATSIKAEPMTWMWAERIPEAAITWIVGQPGNAKSLLTIEIVACTTTGRDWPDGAKNTMGAVKVLMFCGEDDLAKTVIPRLKAAGADLKNVRFLDSRSFRGTVGDMKVPGRSIDLDQDMETLLGMLKASPDIRLLVCDPITGIFGEKQINKDPEINPLLEDLVDLCRTANLTFVGVCHTPKRQTNSSIEKIAGGSSVAGKCRAAFMLSNDPASDDKHDHLMTIIKGNLTGKLDGLKYRTVPFLLVEDGIEIPIVRIEWREATDMNADDVLAAQNSKKDERDKQQDKCDAFLQTYLDGGPKRSPDVYDAAKAQGYGESTVKRSMRNISGRHIDGRTVGKGNGWWMALPGKDSFPEQVSFETRIPAPEYQEAL